MPHREPRPLKATTPSASLSGCSQQVAAERVRDMSVGKVRISEETIRSRAYL